MRAASRVVVCEYEAIVSVCFAGNVTDLAAMLCVTLQNRPPNQSHHESKLASLCNRDRHHLMCFCRRARSVKKLLQTGICPIILRSHPA